MSFEFDKDIHAADIESIFTDLSAALGMEGELEYNAEVTDGDGFWSKISTPCPLCKENLAFFFHTHLFYCSHCDKTITPGYLLKYILDLFETVYTDCLGTYRILNQIPQESYHGEEADLFVQE